MPVQLKCQCGKTLNIPDKLAGKAVKCPGCASVLKVPSAGSAPAKQTASGKPPATGQRRPAAAPQRAAAQPPAQQAPKGGLGDMFDEEGFATNVARVCPVCTAEMAANAVLCTSCGYHGESGTKLEGHQTLGVDISHSDLALRKAASDLHSERALQEKMAKGPGMPWWGLALVLFMMVSAVTIGVVTINIRAQVDGNTSFNPISLFCLLAGIAFSLVSIGANLMIVVHAFKQDTVKGILALLIGPYTLFHVFKNAKETWKFLAVNIVTGGIAAALFVAAILG